MRVADSRMYVTWIALSVYCALYFPLALFLVRRLDWRTQLPLVITLPAVWTALEYVRSTLITGFSWYLLAHSQHDHLGMIQVSDLTGAYGVTFCIAAVNALLFEVLYSVQTLRTWLFGLQAIARYRRVGLLAQGLGVASLVVGVGVYGIWRLGQQDYQEGPRVVLVQGNLDQRIRNESSVEAEAARTMADHFYQLSDVAAWLRPDLIVWPETSWPGGWDEVMPGGAVPSSLQRAREWADRWHTSVLVGVNAHVWSEDRQVKRYNSAVLVQPDGQPNGRYNKIHRVPFGEYVPLRDWLPFMNALAPYDFDYSVWPGEDFTRFAMSATPGQSARTFGVLICYEDTDAIVARSFGGGDGKAPADFLLNISNDGWFDGTSEHDEHLAVCRFRAVENRRAVARSVNMGISAVIDGNGRVLAPEPREPPQGAQPLGVRIWEAKATPSAPGLPLREWANYKKVPGVLFASIPIDRRFSLYARLGDWLPWTCLAFVGLALVWTFWRSVVPVA
jgi:apolipoprotein N-acyltransferase